MRTLVIAFCALGLSACNMVYSEKPLFTAADAKGGAKLKPGVWVRPDKDCVVAPDADPLPDCANAVTVAAEAFLPPPGAKLKPGEPESLPYLISGRNPSVIQVQVDLDPPKPGVRWLYFALRPTRSDGGKVVEAHVWFVQCGPPPPKDGKRYVTTEPLPGLTIKDNDCIAADADAVRGAAKASEAWDKDKDAIRWVREK
jgi:hypothetical protein